MTFKKNSSPWNKGLKIPYKQRKHNLSKDKLIYFIKQKNTIKECAKKFNCSEGCVVNFAKVHGIKFNNHTMQLRKPCVIKKMRAKRMQQVFHKSNHLTNIELKIKNFLDSYEIKYINEKNIDNRTLVDFFIAPNICIYADGDYWHNLPKVVTRDVKINDYLIDKGYLVHRFSGKEILNDTYIPKISRIINEVN